MHRQASYDYIIIGAGAAGCVLAARLTEDPSISVLLLEEGGASNSLWVNMPAAMGTAIQSGRFGTRYATAPIPALGGRQLEQIQGRTLGGSSAINGMMYLRGHKADYDGWARLGATGWDHASVLPYFRKSEHHHDRQEAWHGHDGPLGVSSPNPDTLTDLQRAFVAAGISAGFGRSDDFNGPQQAGFGYYDRTVANGTRSGVARVYLAPAARRKNLTIMTGARVERLLIQGSRVTAVEIETSSQRTTIAGGTIILSAGTYVSPAILQRSGIGPARHLEAIGRQCLLDLPGVGENLQNHPDIPMQFTTTAQESLRKVMKFPRKQIVGLQWLLSRTGMAASNHFEAGAFIASADGLSQPDIQLTFFNLALSPDTGAPIEEEAFQVHLTLVRPQSRGHVRIEGKGAPVIQLNYLDAEQDRLALRRSVGLLRKVIQQPPLAGFGIREFEPGPDASDEAEIDAWIRRRLVSFYHPVGTCKIGAGTDPMAVVNPELKLYGLDNLMVADASVMPSVPGGNTYAPTVMIAEKAADLIRANP